MATLRKIKKKSGGYYWELDFYYKGERFRRSTRTDNIQIAKTIKKDIEAKIAKGIFNIGDTNFKKEVTFKDFIDQFLGHSKTYKALGTWKRDGLVLNQFYAFCKNESKTRFLSSVNRMLIDKYVGCRSKEVCPASVNVEIRHIKAALSIACQWGLIQSNPAKGIKPLPIPERAPRFFTMDQMQQILKTIDIQPLKQIVVFAVNTGARLSEIINVRWSDVNFQDKTVRISNKEDFHTKSKRERTIPINAETFELLFGMERKGEYVFSTLVGKKRDKHFVSRRFKEYLRKIDMDEGYSFHSLRHAFASHLVQKGVSLYIVKELLGHSSIKTTEIYAYLLPEKHHEIVGLLSFYRENNGEDGILQLTNNRPKLIQSDTNRYKQTQINTI